MENVNIEVFSFEVFKLLLPRLKMEQVLDCPPKHEGKILPFSLVQSVSHIAFCRFIIYLKNLVTNVPYHHETFSRSSIDFYLFLKNNVKTFYPTQAMTSFDKICMSIVFAAEMYMCCLNKDLLGYVPICWAMYFESDLKDTFYQDGGWKKFDSFIDYITLSNVFKNMDFFTQTYYKKGFCDIKSLVDKEIEIYDKTLLKTDFEKILVGRQSSKKLSCDRCLPMIVSFWYVVYPECFLEVEKMAIEGYIQLLLHMLSDVELEESKRYVEDLFRNNSLENGFHDTDNLSGQDLISYQNLHQQSSIEKAMKTCVTRMYFQRLFLGSNEYLASLNEPDNPAKKDYFNICIFCAQEISKTSETSKIWECEEIKLIKLAIEKTVKSTTIKKLISSAAEKQILPKTEVSGTENAFGTSKNSTKDNQKALEEKDALKMFLVLGVEPGRSVMLNSLKTQNLQYTAKKLSYLSSQQNSKKSKKKKSKTTN